MHLNLFRLTSQKINEDMFNPFKKNFKFYADHIELFNLHRTFNCPFMKEVGF